MKANPRIAIYGRVSTGTQSHDSQISEVREYVQRRWKDSSVTEFLDIASGAKTNRTGLEEMMKMVRRKKIDIVAVFKLDRLGRSLAHLAQIIGEMETSGVALVATSQGIDTSDSNPAARLQLNVLAAVAQFERELIRERVNAGIANARRKGSVFGRPKTVEVHQPEVDRLRKEGLSVREIAAKLGIGSSSVQRLIAEAEKRKE